LADSTGVLSTRAWHWPILGVFTEGGGRQNYPGLGRQVRVARSPEESKRGKEGAKRGVKGGGGVFCKKRGRGGG
jgi:hypothetical protein